MHPFNNSSPPFTLWHLGAQALERQKEYTDAIRTERDDLREEVVKLKDILKVLSHCVNSYFSLLLVVLCRKYEVQCRCVYIFPLFSLSDSTLCVETWHHIGARAKRQWGHR